MTQRVTGQRFRQRKLSTKQNVPVVREHEVEKLDDDEASRHIPKFETGVEKGEEIVSLALTALGFHDKQLRAQRCTYLHVEPCIRILCSDSPLRSLNDSG